MDLLTKGLHLLRRLTEPQALAGLTGEMGLWIYVLLFAIVFCETGLVVLPFLPGDSMLFAVGALGALPGARINLWAMAGLLVLAAVLGDALNYSIGKRMGPAVFHREDSRWLNRRHLQAAHDFYEKYGGKTIILARFVPIVRTFAPFVAGAGTMNYGKFITYNVIGAVAWVVLMMGSGVLFGQLEIVKKNFELVVIGIVVLSVMPMVIEWWKNRGKKDDDAEEKPAEAVAAKD